MLKQILERIRTGGSWTVKALADELDTTPEMIVTLLEDLAQRGYLKSGALQSGGGCAACGGGCGSCSTSASCVRGTADRVWTLNL
jgi:FeoC-like transcriptional regulator